MKCHIHAEIDATGNCRECGNPLCEQCLKTAGGRTLCSLCAEKLAPPGTIASPGEATPGKPNLETATSGESALEGGEAGALEGAAERPVAVKSRGWIIGVGILLVILIAGGLWWSGMIDPLLETPEQRTERLRKEERFRRMGDLIEYGQGKGTDPKAALFATLLKSATRQDVDSGFYLETIKQGEKVVYANLFAEVKELARVENRGRDEAVRAYFKALSLLSRRGVSRGKSMTPGEFSDLVGNRLPGLADDFSSLSGAYMAERFGDAEPNGRTTDRALSSLANIRDKLKGRGRK